jgi:hypothetical protein
MAYQKHLQLKPSNQLVIVPTLIVFTVGLALFSAGAEKLKLRRYFPDS